MGRLVICALLTFALLAPRSAGAAVGLGSERPLAIGDVGFSGPRGVGVDAAGRRYVLSGTEGRVQVFDGGGTRLADWSAPDPDPESRVVGVTHMVVAADGTVYLGSSTGTVRVFDRAGRLLGTWAEKAIPLAADRDGTILGGRPGGLHRFSADGRVLAHLRGQGGAMAAAGQDGRFWLSDGGGVVEGFHRSGRLAFMFGTGEFASSDVHAIFGRGDGAFSSMHGMAVDGRGRLWVASGDRHQVFAPGGRLVSVCELGRQAGMIAIAGKRAVEVRSPLPVASTLRENSARCRPPRQPLSGVAISHRRGHVRIAYRVRRRARVQVWINRTGRGPCDPYEPYALPTCAVESVEMIRPLRGGRGRRRAAIPTRSLSPGTYLVQLRSTDLAGNRLDSPLRRIVVR